MDTPPDPAARLAVDAPSDPAAAVPPLQLRVEVAPGVRLHALAWLPDTPTGPDLLLVHGLASNALLWTGMAELLAAAGHRVVAVDQRAHGRSDPSDTLDLGTLTSDLVAVIAACGLDRPIAIGQSWGGNVVLELARRHPQAVRSVVCVDGGTIELTTSFPDWDACWAALAPPRWDRGVTYRTLAAEARRRAEEDGWPSAAWRAQLGNLAVRPDGTATAILTRDRHEAIVHDLWDHRPSERYPEITVPVLLLPVDTGEASWTHGKRDGVELAQAHLPAARTVWFHDRDHDVHAQAPAEVVAVVREAVADGFLTGGARPPASGPGTPDVDADGRA